MQKLWLDRIAEAKARGEFTQKEIDAAESWQYCVVGEKHLEMPFVVTYMEELSNGPRDDILHRLGRQFYFAVEDNQFAEAESIYFKIEDRIRELKQEAT